MFFEDSVFLMAEAQIERMAEQKKENDQVSRLRKENEELKIKNIALQAIIDTLKAENKKLQNTLDDVLDRQPILVARAEKYAVKEFAEQLNQMAQWLPLTAIPDRFVTVSNINKLVKERTGEE